VVGAAIGIEKRPCDGHASGAERAQPAAATVEKA